MKALTLKVVEDARRQNQHKRESQRAYYQELYDRRRTIEFKPETANMETFVVLPKLMIEDLPCYKAALAVYPVLCTQANFESDGWFTISRENIAKLSGLNPTSVDKALVQLMAIQVPDGHCVERQMVSEGKRHFYQYRVWFIRGDQIELYQGHSILFHTCIVETGVWAQLTKRAKALYLAMRVMAHFDAHCYIQNEGLCELAGIVPSDFTGEMYRNRKWDLCTESLTDVCDLAGICTSNITGTLKQLHHFGLVEEAFEGHFQVYLKPNLRVK